MQPANDDGSQAASKKVLASGKCLFDLSKHGARLKPIAFGSRSCTLVERHFHSFTEEVASGRWSIEQIENIFGDHIFGGSVIVHL